MIKKKVFEDDLIAGMQHELANFSLTKRADLDLTKAVDHLHAAIEIFEEAGMYTKSDQVLSILEKIAIKHRNPKDPRNVSDRHTKGLTPEKQVKNLMDHGHQMNLADNNNADPRTSHTHGPSHIEKLVPESGSREFIGQESRYPKFFSKFSPEERLKMEKEFREYLLKKDKQIREEDALTSVRALDFDEDDPFASTDLRDRPTGDISDSDDDIFSQHMSFEDEV